MRILGAVHPPEAIWKMLACFILPSRPPPRAIAMLDRGIDELHL
jgi:hypothetical protein